MRPEAGKLPQCDGSDGNVAEAGIVTGKVLIRGTAELPEKSKYQNEEEG